MLLHAKFLNGQFGDPALYLWELDSNNAVFVDCGDLSRFSIKQIMKVQAIFLSHCHIDHFAGFDLFLRLHMGSEKQVKLFGPPETSLRVGGKLQGYTWNLLGDQNLEFIVTDLDPEKDKKTITHFHAQNKFHPSNIIEETWSQKNTEANTETNTEIYATDTYAVTCAKLDHRTPSIAYAFKEKPSVKVNAEELEKMGLKPGPWIQKLKELLFSKNISELKDITIQVPTIARSSKPEAELVTENPDTRTFRASELIDKLFSLRSRYKIVYATDGAAHEVNRQELLKLAQGADLLYAETCFLQEDVKLADATLHFTAEFMGRLAAEAGVKTIAPFHFSKRYLNRYDEVLRELTANYAGEIISL